LQLTLVRKPRKLWKVGEITRHTGVSRQTVHNYTLLGLISEVERTRAGHRLFDDSIFARLARIEQLKAQGKRLAEIAVLLNRKGKKRQRGSGIE
jgi:DNA-binding transcriptional MerR regulator